MNKWMLTWNCDDLCDACSLPGREDEALVNIYGLSKTWKVAAVACSQTCSSHKVQRLFFFVPDPVLWGNTINEPNSQKSLTTQSWFISNYSIFLHVGVARRRIHRFLCLKECLYYCSLTIWLTTLCVKHKACTPNPAWFHSVHVNL